MSPEAYLALTATAFDESMTVARILVQQTDQLLAARESMLQTQRNAVLLAMLVILPLVCASTGFFNPSGRTFSVEGALGGEDFGTFGNAFVQLYRLVMSGVCLPLP